MASQYPPSHDRSGKHRQPDSGQHQEVAYTTPGRMRRDLFNQNTDFVRRSIRAQTPRIEQVHAHAQFFLHLIHARAQGCEQTAVNQHRRLSIRLFSLDYGGQRGRCLQKAIAGQQQDDQQTYCFKRRQNRGNLLNVCYQLIEMRQRSSNFSRHIYFSEYSVVNHQEVFAQKAQKHLTLDADKSRKDRGICLRLKAPAQPPAPQVERSL